VKQALAFGFASAGLVFGVAIFGHYAGQHASARVASTPDWQDMVRPAVGSMTAPGAFSGDSATEVALYVPPMPREQQVQEVSKSDLIVKLASVPKLEARLEKAATLILSPPIEKLEALAELGSTERERRESERRFRAAEHRCLAKAIYFEARSESLLGQMAVANVVMNRVNDPNYPNTVCEVVFQNESRRNGCQFSFACDGKPDRPKPGKAWTVAQNIASQFLDGKTVHAVSDATHYHADYVSPNWSSSLRRIKQIGRHIFYSNASGSS